MATPSEKHNLTESVGSLDGSGTSSSPSAGVSVNSGNTSGSAAEMLAALQAGNRYDVGTVIACGGMGAILNAREASIERIVAMKVVLDAGNPTALSRFVTEAKVTGQLEHPNIVPVHELGVDEKQQVFYTMKFVKGVTLRLILENLAKGDAATLKEYSLAALLTILQKVCDAMAFAHSKGVIHRDLKPENIMIGKYGEVLVMDWGLAKILGQAEAVSKNDSDMISPSATATGTQTMAGAVLGTLAYMAPEQATGQIEKMDARSDIYALGGILYHILALRAAVDAKVARTAMMQVSTGAIVPPDKVVGPTTKLPHLPGGRIPESLSAVAMKALALEQKDRYQSVPEFQRDIEKYQNGFATSAEHAGVIKQVTLLVKRNKGIFATGFAAWFVITALLAWFVLNLREKESRAVAGEQKAKSEAERAMKAGDAAKAAEAVAVREKEMARQALGRSQVSLAEAAYREWDSRAMFAALESVPMDLRDGDWRYLHARADNSQASLVPPGGRFMGVAADPKRPGVFAVAATDKSISFYDAATGRRISGFRTTERQQRGFYYRSLDFSPDGARVLVGALGDSSVAIYDARDGKALQEWDATNTDWVRFSSDGARTLDVNLKGELTIHDAATGRALWSTKPISRALFTPANHVLAAQGKTLRLLDGATGAVLKEFPAQRVHVSTMALTADGATLFVGGTNDVVCGSRLSDGATVFEQRLPNIRSWVRIALSANGQRIAAAGAQSGGLRSARVWDVRTGVLLQALLGSAGQIEGFAIHPVSGEIIITGPDTRTWSTLTTRPPQWTMGGYRFASVFAGSDDVFIAANRLVALAGGGKSNTVPASLPPGLSWTSAAAAAADTVAFASGSPSSLFVLRKAGADLTVAYHIPTPSTASRLRLTPDGGRLASVDNYNSILTFDTITGQPLSTCDPAEVANIRDLGWLDRDRLVGIGIKGSRGKSGTEERVVLWDANSGRVLRTARHATAMDRLAIAPGGRYFAEGGEDKRVRFRDASTLEVTREFRAHDGPITALAFHPTKPILATASEDLSVRLWNLDDLSLLEELHRSDVASEALNFSPSGDRLASTDSAGQVSIWDFTAPATAPVVKDVDGWEDHFAALTPENVEQTGQGWRLKDGELFSQDTKRSALPLPGDFAGTSYQMRVKLRQLPAKLAFQVVLPVGDRMCHFSLDGHPAGGVYTGIGLVNGNEAQDVPGVVKGKQMNDTEPHELEVTVRLDGANATITTMLDGQPLQEWTGPTAALSRHKVWATTQPGALALGSSASGWVVSEIKVKRLEAGKKP